MTLTVGEMLSTFRHQNFDFAGASLHEYDSEFSPSRRNIIPQHLQFAMIGGLLLRYNADGAAI